MEFGQIDEVDLLSPAPQKVSGAWPEASTINLIVRLPEVVVNPQVKGDIYQQGKPGAKAMLSHKGWSSLSIGYRSAETGLKQIHYRKPWMNFEEGAE